MKKITFSAERVKMIIGGSKTMDRRVLDPQPVIDDENMWHWNDCQWMDGGLGFPSSAIEDCAPFNAGDVVYVREAWKVVDERYYYKADSGQVYDIPDAFRPPITMPQEAARLFLRIKSVRAERLQSISWDDCRKEGYEESPLETAARFGWIAFLFFFPFSYRFGWDSNYSNRDFPWSSNPWVWAYEFEVCGNDQKAT